MCCDPRREHQDPPQAPDHRRDHRQQVDHVHDRPRPPVRHDLGQQQGDAHADRDGDDERDHRRDGRAVDEGQRAELVGRGVPGVGEDLHALGGEPRRGLLAGRDGDQDEDHQHQQAGRQREDLEGAVAERPPLGQRAGGSGRAGRIRLRQALTMTPIPRRGDAHRAYEPILLSCALACWSMLEGSGA